MLYACNPLSLPPSAFLLFFMSLVTCHWVHHLSGCLIIQASLSEGKGFSRSFFKTSLVFRFWEEEHFDPRWLGAPGAVLV